jgi:hypothetical protein
MSVWRQALRWKKSSTSPFRGTPGQSIKFVALPDGEADDIRVVIHGAFELAAGVSRSEFWDFVLRDFPIWGLRCTGNRTSSCWVSMSGGEAGIHFTYGYSGEDPLEGPVNNIQLLNSAIHDTIYTAVDCTPGPCNNMLFQRLEIYGAGMDGEEANFGADALAVERGATIVVEDSVIHDNGGDGIDLNSRDQGETMPGIVVRRKRLAAIARMGSSCGQVAKPNNVVWNSGEENLVLVAGGDYVITNNTFANRASYGYLALLVDGEAANPTQINLYNNISTTITRRWAGRSSTSRPTCSSKPIITSITIRTARKT